MIWSVVAGALLTIGFGSLIIAMNKGSFESAPFIGVAFIFLIAGSVLLAVEKSKVDGGFASGAVSVLVDEDAEFLSVDKDGYILIKSETGVYRVLVVEDGEMKGIEVIYHGDQVVYGEEKEIDKKCTAFKLGEIEEVPC